MTADAPADMGVDTTADTRADVGVDTSIDTRLDTSPEHSTGLCPDTYPGCAFVNGAAGACAVYCPSPNGGCGSPVRCCAVP